MHQHHRFRAPKQTPPLSTLLADLGHPHAASVAALLGVHERTVYGWQARDVAPRPALLALFCFGKALGAVNGS